MSDRVKFGALIREDVLNAFRNLVIEKYGCLKGYFSEEVERALDEYIRSHNTHIEHIDISLKAKHIRLLKFLEDRYEVLYSEIRDFIHKNFGVDKRTERKYFNDFLLKYNFVKVRHMLRFGEEYILEVNTSLIKEFLQSVEK